MGKNSAEAVLIVIPAGTFESFATEKEMEIALNNLTDDATVALLFPADARNNTLQYTMRWPSDFSMYTDTIFVDASKPRNVDKFSDGELRYLWPLMYAVFTEHLKYFKVSEWYGRISFCHS